MDLTGAVILVTGASSGIGRETAILLSSLNARLVVVGRNRERLDQTMAALTGDGHHAEEFDLSQVAEVPQWVKRIAAEVGPLQGIVHAAGVQQTTPVRFLSPLALDELLRTNLSSAIMLVRGFCQKNCSTSGGSIVFVSSVMGLVGRPGLSGYSASKAALIGLARSLALELAQQRIRVNCVAPAFVETEMLLRLREELPEGELARIEAAHPLGFGTPRDVAHSIAFLLAETGRWITGSTLVVDGGYSAQ
jgi:NAD(P)-dependent dehydrogenase (short-subunit alcohol dehydrogenase family)